MKDIRIALRTLLLADPAVNALVGGFRIHNVRMPQDQVEPSLVFVKVSETGDYHLMGDSGLGQMRMQLDAWSQNADLSTELSNAVYDRLSGARETVNFDSQFINLRGAFVVNGRDDYDDVAQLFRASRDYIVWYGASQ